MAKRRGKWSEKIIAQRVKEGRGSGAGEHYKPWITVQDFPSAGLASRDKGWKTNRVHQLMSQLENQVLRVFEWDDRITDIREQFPLNRNVTMQVAEENKIRHPYYKHTEVPVVMTTDFVCTLKGEGGEPPVLMARAVKPASELYKKRTIEKLEMERRYWEKKGVDWGIITDKELNKIFTKNMNWIHRDYYLDEEYAQKNLDIYARELNEVLDEKDITYREAIAYIAEKYNIEVAESLSLFKHLVARKKVLVNIMEEITLLGSRKPKG